MDEVVDRKAIEARARARNWREVNQEKGLCPKHATHAAKLSHCFACRPGVELRSPKTGDRLKACVCCAGCGRCYHAGSIYHHISARRLRGIQPGPNNSLFNFDKRKEGDPDKVLSLCGECRVEDGRDDWKKGKYRSYRVWSGLCSTHARYARRRSGDVEHRPSGAIVHRSERVREPGWRQRPIKVKFTCADRENGLHKSEVYLSSTEHADGEPRLEWRGLCPEHLRQAGALTRIRENQTIDGAELLFEEEDGQGLVPILYEVCKHKRLAPRQTALSYRHEGHVSGVCLECRNNPAAFAERLAELTRQAETNNGQKNGGSEKRSGGRPRAFTDEQAFEAIDALKSRASGVQVAKALKCARSTVNKWAQSKGFGSLAELIQQRRSNRGGVGNVI